MPTTIATEAAQRTMPKRSRRTQLRHFRALRGRTRAHYADRILGRAILARDFYNRTHGGRIVLGSGYIHSRHVDLVIPASRVDARLPWASKLGPGDRSNSTGHGATPSDSEGRDPSSLITVTETMEQTADTVQASSVDAARSTGPGAFRHTGWVVVEGLEQAPANGAASCGRDVPCPERLGDHNQVRRNGAHGRRALELRVRPR